jgi:transcriptional regulator with GAF, ATPase, and Fis domain
MVTSTREGQLVETFVTLADTLVADYDVVDLLHTLVVKCATLLDAAAAGIIFSTNDGDVDVVASTDEHDRLVEILQLCSASGPCVESVTTGHAVSIPEIALLGDRWPRFQDAAGEQGFTSMHSVPLRLRDTMLGSLTLFWDQVVDLDAVDALAVQTLADVATIGILQERAIRESDVVRQQLQHALSSRILIEQAKGVIAYIKAVQIPDAFTLIRDYSRRNGIPLADVAEQIVNRTLIF